MNFLFRRVLLVEDSGRLDPTDGTNLKPSHVFWYGSRHAEDENVRRLELWVVTGSVLRQRLPSRSIQLGVGRGGTTTPGSDYTWDFFFTDAFFYHYPKALAVL